MIMHFKVMKLDGLLCSSLQLGFAQSAFMYRMDRLDSHESVLFFMQHHLKAVYLTRYHFPLCSAIYSIISLTLFVLLASSTKQLQPTVTMSTFLWGRCIGTTVPQLLSRLPLFLIHRMEQTANPTALLPSLLFLLCHVVQSPPTSASCSILRLLILPSSSISSKCSYIFFRPACTCLKLLTL